MRKRQTGGQPDGGIRQTAVMSTEQPLADGDQPTSPVPGRRRRAHAGGKDLKRYAPLFASRTKVMRSSAMRDLMELTARPEVISLAGGQTDTGLFGSGEFARLMTKIAHESAAKALQYGPTEGFASAKECVREVMAAEGMFPDDDDIIITTGGQQAIDLITKTLIDPGDLIIAEGPTYAGAIPTFSAYEADVIHVEMDSDGMRIDRLAELLDSLEAEGRRPKFIYSVPTFQNPAGVTMSGERRRQLVDLVRSRELLLVEDNPYGLMRFEGEPETPLYALDGGDYVVHLGTFSKLISPGVRLGWLCAPPPLMEKIVIGKQASDLCTSTLSQFFVAELFESGRWREFVELSAATYRGRRDTMIEALEESFPEGVSWSKPEGGLFVWATLPDYIDTTDLLTRALADNVAFVPGTAAFVDGRGRDSMRLNFSGVDDSDIREGIRRIGAVVTRQVELYESITRPEAIRRKPLPDADSPDNVVAFRRDEPR